MVVIRLARHGAHNAPYYRIVVADRRKRRDGRIIEQVGTYDPKTDPSTITLDTEKVDAWIAKGAQPSETVSKLIAIAKGEASPVAASKPSKSDAEAEAAEPVAEAEAAEPVAEAEAEAAEPEPEPEAESEAEPEVEEQDSKDEEA